MPRFGDIPQYVRDGSYMVHTSYDYLEENLYRWYTEIDNRNKLDYDDFKAQDGVFEVPVPDFQRGHVWTENQRIAFMEYLLRGGISGPIRFNQPGWQTNWRGPFEIVDGLQRATTLLKFANDELPVFGYTLSQYDDKPRMMDVRLELRVNSLATRAEVLTWYLQLNGGGTPHSDDELNRVQGLLNEEESA